MFELLIPVQHNVSALLLRAKNDVLIVQIVLAVAKRSYV